MRDLARATGIQPATLYSHISGKETLLFEILGEMVQKFAAGAADIVENDQPADEMLKSFCRFHMEVVASHLEAATVHFHEYRYLPAERLRELIEYRDAYEEGVRSILTRGIESGHFRQLDVPVTAICILSMLNYAYQWFTPSGRLSPGDLGGYFAELLIRGIDARPHMELSKPNAVGIETDS